MSAVAWTVMKKHSSELVCWLWTYGKKQQHNTISLLSKQLEKTKKRKKR